MQQDPETGSVSIVHSPHADFKGNTCHGKIPYASERPEVEILESGMLQTALNSDLSGG